MACAGLGKVTAFSLSSYFTPWNVDQNHHLPLTVRSSIWFDGEELLLRLSFNVILQHRAFSSFLIWSERTYVEIFI